tara:strand:- start:13809 stop:14198 length:390 start_codon:yes stop_codon:yes gene_type:complete
MKNYFIGSFCVFFLFACGGSEDSVADVEVSEVEVSSPKAKEEDNSASKKFIKEFSEAYMEQCEVAGNEQGLAPMFAMMGVDYVEYCQCTLDEALRGETYSSLSDSTAESRLMMKIMGSAESCMSKYLPM